MDETESARQIWQSLGLPGIVDVHTHFMPKPVRPLVEPGRHLGFSGLRLVVARLGMPQYTDFLDLADRYEDVRFDNGCATTPTGSSSGATFPTFRMASSTRRAY